MGTMVQRQETKEMTNKDIFESLKYQEGGSIILK